MLAFVITHLSAHSLLLISLPLAQDGLVALMRPWRSAAGTALLLVWIHACIGIHFWLRTKLWYPDWRVAFAAFALLLPTLALSGFLSAGNQLMREAVRDPKFVETALGDASITADTLASTDRIAALIVLTHVGLLVLVFVARAVRRRIYESRRPPVLAHPSGAKVPVLPGATV